MLLKINQGIPTDLQHRFNELVAKRQSLTLSKAEHTELIQLGDHIEQLNTERIKHLAALAKLRNRSLAEIMQDSDFRLDSITRTKIIRNLIG